jgi:formylglycine-generating enzyme required for sulfatase activity
MLATAMAAAAVLLAGTAGSPPTLTGIEVKLSPPKDVTVRGTGEAGTGYLLQWSKWLGEGELWEDAGEATAEADGSFAVSPIAECRSPGFYRVVEPEEPEPVPLFLLVNMREGLSAQSWPVTRFAGVPEGGWTEEYKTMWLVLRRIPAGSFLMGSPEGEKWHHESEKQHEVVLTKDFYMGVFEVTQEQYERVTGRNPAMYKGPTRPVEGMSRDAIQADFLAVLRAKTGLEFGLPTEAQWEYACRAGTTTHLNSGKDLTDEYRCTNLAAVARYKYNHQDGKGRYSDGHTEVGSYEPNAWNLHDMHGNVDEWCLDRFGEYPDGPVRDPEGSEEGEECVVRGGNCSSEARFCRSAFRDSRAPSEVSYARGFRLVCPDTAPYLVVDMNGGQEAESWPVEEMQDVPSGGWSDEYKTGKLVLRRIPAGTFTMGSTTNEVGWTSSGSEVQHKVTLTKPFYMGVFEVTQRQWELATGKRPSYFRNTDFYATRPVEQVRHDAIRGADAGLGWPTNGHAVDPGSFLGILREKTGLEFDLPTAAQWEYACRAGTTNALNSGKELTSATNACPNLDELGRYCFNGGRDESGNWAAETCDTSEGTAAVGSYRPNAWGLYDMHGNVNEWCLDRGPVRDASDATDPAGPETGRYRSNCGGCWLALPSECRSDSVGIGLDSSGRPYVGLRLVVP